MRGRGWIWLAALMGLMGLAFARWPEPRPEAPLARAPRPLELPETKPEPDDKRPPIPLPRREEEGVAAELPDPTPEERDLILGPRSPLPVPDYRQGEVSPACLELWHGLRALDLRPAGAAGAAGLPDARGCQGVPARFEAWHRDYLRVCRQREPGNCLDTLRLYRAEITDWLTKELLPPDSTDPKLWADKMFARYRTDPATAARFADRAFQLSPGLHAAARVAYLGRVTEAQWHGQDETPEGQKRWADAERALHRLVSSAANDPARRREAAEMAVLVELRHDDPSRIERLADRLDSDFSSSGTGPYLRAFLSYKEGDAERALDWLVEARRRNPASARFRDTAERVAAAREGRGDPGRVFYFGYEIFEPMKRR